ncbi:phage head-tail family protein, putative [Ichthyophthirius multifiliis]|uniref:Phage head-tail family protein, putative n=1 Tax=Ichthyophthirius multifiliis TaxID=5932 RepID=G0QZ85_ICHMU|nr:phage head-tail family protein, putative [Ichthyophthirius multifiliis]EGR29468.1 phage head-tail family protein, putative [Ichthyophthirius multifiliis]|eukprot:XP_004030704.1 phage head-tail family protein, putative [Ichthyophthirius multifiliis]
MNVLKTEPVKILQGHRVLVPEYDKLTKMEKLLTKIESDIQKRTKDQDKIAFLDTMKKVYLKKKIKYFYFKQTYILKKTHQLYQLILGEMHYQLGILKLDKFTSIIQKIFSGQNILMNVILQMKTNMEFDVDQLLYNLKNLKTRSVQQKRNNSFDVSKTSEQNISIPSYDKRDQYKPSLMKRLNKQESRLLQNYERIITMEKGTDTEEDMINAKRSSNIIQKQNEIEQIKNELIEANNDVSEFLNNKKNLNFGLEPSNAEKSLRSVLKDLSQKKNMLLNVLLFFFQKKNLFQWNRKDQIYQENNLCLIMDMKELKTIQLQDQKMLQIELRMHKKTINISKILKIVKIKEILNFKKTQHKFEKLQFEIKQKEKKLQDLEKKFKDIKNNNEQLEIKFKGVNGKLEEMLFAQKKRDDEEKARRKNTQKDIVFSQVDKDKIKKIIEENIKLKLKMKELVEEIKKIEDENKHNLNSFRKFIMSSNLTDEQKRFILGKAEDLFKLEYSKRFNIKEIEQMAKIDLEMLKDPLVKDCVGDGLLLVKNIKAEEKAKQQERLNNPNYDSEFDPELLEEGEKLIVRKVKRKVKRLNSKGEWIEDEIEIEEEVIIDTKTGKELRSRDKAPQSGLVVDPAIVDFVNKHGGLAIGGSKFVLPQKPGRPIDKDGKPVNEGEWFIDEKGNRVKMVKNANGDEEYEIEEKYIDENGQEKVRVKKMKVKKDQVIFTFLYFIKLYIIQNGNEYTEEQFIDPNTGKKVNVVKKVIKDKDGNDIIEEVTTDENGNKVVKRIKVQKDKDGNDVIEEEIVDQFGNKQIIRTKKMKDKDGNEVIVKEILNADGTVTTVTEKIDKKGNKIVIEEKIDKFGNKTKTEKKIVVGADGKQIIEEIYFDEKGNKITKNTKTMVDENGNSYAQETIVDQFGNKIIKNVRKKVDQNGNMYIEEEIIEADGKKRIIKKTVDKDGNEIEQEEIIDEHGNKIIITKKKNKDGIVTEERYNPLTGEKTILKKHIDSSGREVIEETKIDKNGNTQVTKKILSKDKNGNTIIEESFIDPKTGKQVTVQKKLTKDKFGNQIIEETYIDPSTGKQVTVKMKITKDKDANEVIEESYIDPATGKTVKKKVIKDKDGNEIIEESYIDPTTGKTVTIRKKITKDKDGNNIVEEQVIDENGNAKTVKTKVYRDIDGKQVIEEEITGADGKKYKVMKKFYRDENGNEIVEEEILDDNGNKVIIKKKIGKDGKITIEETKIGKDGKKTITQKIINNDGTIQETTIDSNGKVIHRQVNGQSKQEKEVQTDFDLEKQLKAILLQLGCDNSKVDELVQQIIDFINKGEAIVMGDSKKITNRMQQKGIIDDIINMSGHQVIKQNKYIKKNDNQQENEDKQLELLDGMDEDQQLEALFKKFMSKKNEMGDLIKLVKNNAGKNNNEDLDIEDFKKYFRKMQEIHAKCGENCPHLKRFYERLGFTWQKYKRRYLKLKDTKIQAFNKVKEVKNSLKSPQKEDYIWEPVEEAKSQSKGNVTNFPSNDEINKDK